MDPGSIKLQKILKKVRLNLARYSLRCYDFKR